MLKEADDPTRRRTARPHRRRRAAAAGGRRAAGHPGRQGGEVHRHRRRRHPQLRGPGLLDQAGRQSGPAQRDLGQGRPPGRLFRPVLRSCAARATATCRSRSKWCRRRNSPQWVASKGGTMPGARAAAADRRPAWRAAVPAAATPSAAAAGRRRARNPAARDQPGRDGPELRAEATAHEHHSRRRASPQGPRGARRAPRRRP